MTPMKLAKHLLASSLALLFSGCLAPESFLAKTNAKIEGCLRVGISAAAADACLGDAGISFSGSLEGLDARLSDTGSGAVDIGVGSLFRLHFDNAGILESWTSEVRSDGP